ncbi:MAG: amphi-Trp domain-containing protein [Chloroflexota bacterium]
MPKKDARDVEKILSVSDFVSKLRRLADALENDDKFGIQIAGERIYVPSRAQFSLEHEREGDEEEIEFQIKWKND